MTETEAADPAAELIALLSVTVNVCLSFKLRRYVIVGDRPHDFFPVHIEAAWRCR